MSKSGVFNTIGSVLGMLNSGANGTAEIAASYMDDWRKARELTVAENKVERAVQWTALETKINKLHSENKLNKDSKSKVTDFIKDL